MKSLDTLDKDKAYVLFALDDGNSKADFEYSMKTMDVPYLSSLQGYYKGVLENSYAVDLMDWINLNMSGWSAVAEQESVLVLYTEDPNRNDMRRATLVYLADDKCERIGWFKEVPIHYHAHDEGWTYDRITDKFYICEDNFEIIQTETEKEPMSNSNRGGVTEHSTEEFWNSFVLFNIDDDDEAEEMIEAGKERGFEIVQLENHDGIYQIPIYIVNQGSYYKNLELFQYYTLGQESALLLDKPEVSSKAARDVWLLNIGDQLNEPTLGEIGQSHFAGTMHQINSAAGLPDTYVRNPNNGCYWVFEFETGGTE